MEQVVVMEGDYKAGELFTGDISQIMGIEEEVNDVSTSDKNVTPRTSQTFNHCYKCGKTGHFQKDCPGDSDEENMEPQHKIIGTVTHTMEAQTPVTDKSLIKLIKINSTLQKEGQSTEDELDAVDALLGLQHLHDKSIVPLEDDNSELMPIGGGENVPEDIAPQPLLLDQVNVDNAIATMIATEQETDINTNRNKEQAENTSRMSKGENPPITNPLDGVHIANVGTSAVKNRSDGDKSNVAEGVTIEKDSDGDKIQPSHGAFKMQLHGLKRKAPADRSYRCQLCGAHECSQQSLNIHHHLQHEAQMCGTCGKIFELAMSLSHHMYSHYESKYYCEKCNYHCYFKSELKTHKKMHHTTPQHQCMYPKCGRWFMQKGDLVIHVETHRKCKLKCDDCDFETKSRKYLKEHQRVHGDNLPYRCEKCGKGFKWHSSICNHRKNAH